MAFFLFIKCFLIGIAWGGSFLWIASIAFYMYPLPFLIRMRNALFNFSKGKYTTNPTWGKRFWNISSTFLRICIALIWLLLPFGYAYGLVYWLNFYLPTDLSAAMYWAYYAVAAAPTCFLLIWWGFRLIKGKKTSLGAYLPDNPALLKED